MGNWKDRPADQAGSRQPRSGYGSGFQQRESGPSGGNDEGEILAELERKRPDEDEAKEKLRIAVKEFNGNRYLDLRVWFVGDRGDWLPTKKGVTIRAKELKAFLQAVSQAESRLGGGPAVQTSGQPSEGGEDVIPF